MGIALLIASCALFTMPFCDLKGLLGFADRDPVKFGLGRSQDELRNCDDITVFMVCEGYIGDEKVRKELPKHCTVSEARSSFGRVMRQQTAKDENGYAVNGNKKLWELSNQCKLKLSFAYGAATEQEEAIRLAKEGAVIVTERSKQGLEEGTRLAKEAAPVFAEIAEKSKHGLLEATRWLTSQTSKN